MWQYALRRVLQSIPLIFGILTLLFFLLQLAPGDPASYFFNPEMPPDVISLMRKNLGLDDPVLVQYLKWIKSAILLDFGRSFFQQRPVIDLIGEAFPNTLVLSAITLIMIYLVGTTLGIISSIKQYSLTDNVTTVVSFFLYSMPSFWLSLMLILIFSKGLLWFPSSHMTSIGYESMSLLGKVWDRLLHLLLPAFGLGIAYAAGVGRYMRTSMLEVIRQDFIRTARAKGISERKVIFKHCMRNALIPIVTLFGLYLPFLFSGSVLVETIFSWPGMGRLIVSSIFQRDFPVVLGTSFFFAVMVIAGNLVSDILYAVVDPRIKYT